MNMERRTASYGIPEGTYPAHVKINGDGSLAFHTVYEHCSQVGKRMKEMLKPIGLGSIGELIGLYHDEGKHCPEFREYLLSKTIGDGTVRRRNFHSLGGTNLFWDLETECEKGSAERLACELIADVIFSHHTRHDFLMQDEESGCTAYKIDKRMPEDAERRAFMKAYEDEVGAERSKILLRQAANEIRKKTEPLNRIAEDEIRIMKEERTPIKQAAQIIDTAKRQEVVKSFFLGMLYRTLLSALIYADHEDSAKFAYPDMPVTEYKSDWKSLSEHMGTLYSHSKKTSVNAERQKISDICASFGSAHACGIYKMNVPTGGGKTMSSLRLVSEAIAASGHPRRAFFIMPLLSIIEQNAGDMRKAAGEYVTAEEFHSNVKREKPENSACMNEETEDENEPAKRIATDADWNAPMIITSLVQFLNAVFKGDSANLKRFSSLMNGVIVIDEVQSVPRKMMSLFSLAIDFLAYGCGCLVILCSATQPEFERMRFPIIYDGEIEKNKNVIGWDEIDHNVFRRVEYVNLGLMTEEQIAEKVKEIAESSFLIICNKKDTVRKLYGLLENWCAENRISLRCISADMCKAHRNDVMRRIREETGRKIVISTQVMEAGVNMSFANVLRISAGADNLAQAAGRCNRNGEYSEPRKVYCAELRGEKLKRLPDIEDSKQAFRDASDGEEEFMSEAMISEYYRKRDSAERNLKGSFDFPLFSGADEDNTILNLLSCNRKMLQKAPDDVEFMTRHRIKQSFRTAWNLFKVFDEETESAVVNYGKGKELISDLCSEKAKRDAGYMKACLKKAQEYQISIYADETEKLIERGVLVPVCEGTVLTVSPEYYSQDFGFMRKAEAEAGKEESGT